MKEIFEVVRYIRDGKVIVSRETVEDGIKTFEEALEILKNIDSCASSIDVKMYEYEEGWMYDSAYRDAEGDDYYAVIWYPAND